MTIVNLPIPMLMKMGEQLTYPPMEASERVLEIRKLSTMRVFVLMSV